nr:uncharacterized protein LOC124814088 [Hydra vulgaris]
MGFLKLIVAHLSKYPERLFLKFSKNKFEPQNMFELLLTLNELQEVIVILEDHFLKNVYQGVKRKRNSGQSLVVYRKNLKLFDSWRDHNVMIDSKWREVYQVVCREYDNYKMDMETMTEDEFIKRIKFCLKLRYNMNDDEYFLYNSVYNFISILIKPYTKWDCHMDQLIDFFISEDAIDIFATRFNKVPLVIKLLKVHYLALILECWKNSPSMKNHFDEYDFWTSDQIERYENQTFNDIQVDRHQMQAFLTYFKKQSEYFISDSHRTKFNYVLEANNAIVSLYEEDDKDDFWEKVKNHYFFGRLIV